MAYEFYMFLLGAGWTAGQIGFLLISGVREQQQLLGFDVQTLLKFGVGEDVLKKTLQVLSKHESQKFDEFMYTGLGVNQTDVFFARLHDALINLNYDSARLFQILASDGWLIDEALLTNPDYDLTDVDFALFIFVRLIMHNSAPFTEEVKKYMLGKLPNWEGANESSAEIVEHLSDSTQDFALFAMSHAGYDQTIKQIIALCAIIGRECAITSWPAVRTQLSLIQQ